MHDSLETGFFLQLETALKQFAVLFLLPLANPMKGCNLSLWSFFTTIRFLIFKCPFFAQWPLFLFLNKFLNFCLKKAILGVFMHQPGTFPIMQELTPAGIERPEFLKLRPILLGVFFWVQESLFEWNRRLKAFGKAFLFLTPEWFLANELGNRFDLTPLHLLSLY